ncbi:MULTISPECIES: YARHG domain-containing protein [Aquimarina]|uniref:YARHG domain-containing protein n=1 Tax=Aquimarina TaxID=290174 RepID=UPI000942DD03|nr:MULTISPECIES: YARHG domain-containing protein [Aquimarina]
MQKIIFFILFMFMTYLVQAEAFLQIYPNQLNFKNYPTITTTCIIKDMDDCKMIPKNVDQFNFSIIENGLYIPKVNCTFKKQIDNNQVIIELSYTSLSPMYMHRDITFNLHADNHFTHKRDNYIFLNTGKIVDSEMKTMQINRHLSKYSQPTNQNNVKSDSSLFTDRSLYECSLEELHIMRNEYYAQKGYIFKSDKLNNYFKTQKWYTPIFRDQNIIQFTQEEAAEIAYLQYYEHLKSKANLTIDFIEYYDTDMIKKIGYKHQQSYDTQTKEDKKKTININKTYISYNEKERQPKEIVFNNIYHRHEQFRQYYPNGNVEKELFIHDRTNIYDIIESAYFNTGGEKGKQFHGKGLNIPELEHYKNRWSIDKYIQEENNDTKYSTIYDLYSPSTLSEEEMNHFIHDSLKTNINGEYNIEDLKLLYELKYPNAEIFSPSIDDYIKGDNGKYLHYPQLNYTDKNLLLEKHDVYFIFVSKKNEVYKQKLYEKDAAKTSDGWIVYDDNYVEEINKKYKVHDWITEDGYIELFHPDMDFGNYIIFMQITFSEHKKTFYSKKHRLEYVPLGKITNEN